MENTTSAELPKKLNGSWPVYDNACPRVLYLPTISWQLCGSASQLDTGKALHPLMTRTLLTFSLSIPMHAYVSFEEASKYRLWISTGRLRLKFRRGARSRRPCPRMRSRPDVFSAPTLVAHEIPNDRTGVTLPGYTSGSSQTFSPGALIGEGSTGLRTA